MMERYVLVEIGCLECGNPSDLIGTYATIEDAKTAAQVSLDTGVAIMNERHGGTWKARTLIWDDEPGGESTWNGDGISVIWDLETLALVAAAD